MHFKNSRCRNLKLEIGDILLNDKFVNQHYIHLPSLFLYCLGINFESQCSVNGYIRSFHHSIILSFNHSLILSFNHSHFQILFQEMFLFSMVQYLLLKYLLLKMKFYHFAQKQQSQLHLIVQ